LAALLVVGGVRLSARARASFHRLHPSPAAPQAAFQRQLQCKGQGQRGPLRAEAARLRSLAETLRGAVETPCAARLPALPRPPLPSLCVPAGEPRRAGASVPRLLQYFVHSSLARFSCSPSRHKTAYTEAGEWMRACVAAFGAPKPASAAVIASYLAVHLTEDQTLLVAAAVAAASAPLSSPTLYDDEESAAGTSPSPRQRTASFRDAAAAAAASASSEPGRWSTTNLRAASPQIVAGATAFTSAVGSFARTEAAKAAKAAAEKADAAAKAAADAAALDGGDVAFVAAAAAADPLKPQVQPPPIRSVLQMTRDEARAFGIPWARMAQIKSALAEDMLTLSLGVPVDLVPRRYLEVRF
jgi:hypothetical protein